MTAATDIVPQAIPLNKLLDWIEEGELTLPNFQRDFDWPDGDIISLLATVLFGWPAGSLLLMRSGTDLIFSTRSFEQAPSFSGPGRHIVLDGQQRLTALYQALKGAGPNVYAIPLTDVSADSMAETAEELEESIVVVKRKDWDANYPLKRLAEEALVPLYTLSSTSDFFLWRDEVVAAAPTASAAHLSQRLARAYKNLLGNVHGYSFPAVVLEPTLPPEAVSRIFERLNRGGRRLTQFDLLVARSYTADWNLRDKWEEARRETRYLDSFMGEDGLPVLQVMSLLSTGDIRQPHLLRLDRTLIRSGWEETISAADEACGFVTSMGVESGALLPYKGLLLPLAALASRGRMTSRLGLLRSWFWQRSLSLNYEVASSTKISSDYRVLAGESPDMLELDPVDSLSLITATRRNAAPVWRAFMSLLNAQGIIDPTTGERVPAAETVAIPLFPRTVDGNSGLHLRVLAQVLVPKKVARLLRQQNILQFARSSEYGGAWLDSQLLPAPADLAEMLPFPREVLLYRLSRCIDLAQRVAPALQFTTVSPSEAEL